MPCGESKTETFHTFGKMSKLQNGLDKPSFIETKKRGGANKRNGGAGGVKCRVKLVGNDVWRDG